MNRAAGKVLASRGEVSVAATKGHFDRMRRDESSEGGLPLFNNFVQTSQIRSTLAPSLLAPFLLRNLSIKPEQSAGVKRNIAKITCQYSRSYDADTRDAFLLECAF